MNVAELEAQAVERLGERMVLDFEDEQFTNLQLLDWGRRLQRGFAGLGLKHGDVTLLCMMNHPLIYPVFQGIFRNGAVALPVMFMLAEAELRYILSDSNAQGIVTDAMNLPKVREAVKELDRIAWIVVLGGEDNPSASPPEYSLDGLLKEAPMESLPAINDQDLAMMLYTAGTTGKPKGVMLTHANLLAGAEAAAEGAEIEKHTATRIMMSAMPMAHIFGVGVMMAGYMTPKRIADGYGVQMSWFEPERFMQLIVKHRCNTMAAVPTMLIFILNHPKVDEYDLSCLDEVVCGAASLPVEIARIFSERYNCRIREIYGQTESVGIGAANRISWPYKPGSCGKAYSNTELQIMDENDYFLSTGKIGEVVLRGPTVMKGYYQRPDETSETLRNGWLHTGDMGYLDEEGYLFIVDRKKDLIIKAGENIFPAELESIMFEIEGIAEAAVVGRSDPVYGELPVGFAVLKPAVELSAEEIIAHMQTRTAPFKVPAEIHFINALPKSPVGKILRRELREGLKE